MFSEGKDIPVLQDDDPVGQQQGGSAMGDHDGGPLPHGLDEFGVYMSFRDGVHRRGGVVEYEDAGVSDYRPRQGHSLALASREAETPLAYHGVVAVGEVLDELVGIGDPGRGHDL